MKWDATEQTQGVFNYSAAEIIMNFAEKYNMSVRGHNLVWYSQIPTWVSAGNWTNATLTEAMVNHITNVVTYFKGRVIHWDVVNEPFFDNGTFRTNVFYNNIGEDYIRIAFNAARSADPNVKLYINDYNLENAPKYTAMVNLVSKLRSQGVPIDGIGTQMHLIVGAVPAATIKYSFGNLTSTGAELAITELDIRTSTPITTTNADQQAADYATVVNACLANSNCVGVETWGISDGFSWIPSVFSGYGAALPYDENFQPKLARTAIAGAFLGLAEESGGCASLYGQCGGSSYTGPTCCTIGSVCQVQSTYWSQCVLA
ncbi:hypothetical protein HDU83_006974 [Entophlyctis luteolus]|nr:hypothetical protein HDU82_000559 [Entophlyctis luteolus]KAJ3353294.1 hypothetical protein HDU83_006974 [Entophlyctis luteolus]KAJ3388248.1 hypothetical protein HDU84_000169 [Entophlyctis sp. JEL0112]